ncbi:MAG: NADP-dependent phosphogluconate dehydrogenase [Limnochordia bacterium]|nr:NADP-dependent phosphogluconate dehydrogenase [Limnochordia bacterium]
MSLADIGVVGLAVMGQNLALNIAEHGYTVSVYNRTKARTRAFMENTGPLSITPFYTLPEFVTSLSRPRRILLMVRATAVDDVLKELSGMLGPGDVVLDGGNSYFKDTMHREDILGKQGVYYLGVGISGGEEGARYGPSIMPGGEPQAYDLVAPILTDIAAKAEDQIPCCAYLGPGGTGHFVKMVHNGIEYALMQAIAEAYALMRYVLNMGTKDIAEVFHRWNETELGAYLMEITVHILRKTDKVLDRPLVDVILDAAEQKGTGMWTVEQSLQLGVATPTLAEALYARYISTLHIQRQTASKLLPGAAPIAVESSQGVINYIREGLYASMICIYAQGFALLGMASKEFQWDLNLQTVARIWRSGCIIRSRLLDPIAMAYAQEPVVSNLLIAEPFIQALGRAQAGWRKCVSLAVEAGIAVSAMGSALGYYDAYRTSRSGASLIQAQRDYFGSHTYRRVDKPGIFHTDWQKD